MFKLSAEPSGGCVRELARAKRWSGAQWWGAQCRTIGSRQSSRTTAACSTWVTAIRCIGSAAGTPLADPCSICTAAPVQAARRASDASSIQMPIGSYSSTSVGAGGAPLTGQPAGCVPLSGFDALGGGPTQVVGPGFHRLDFSIFKEIPLTERYRLQFRTEVFNIFNHPNFNAPGFGGNGVVAISNSTNFNDSRFGEIGSTRDAPYDPRQIQFALKLYY